MKKKKKEKLGEGGNNIRSAMFNWWDSEKKIQVSEISEDFPLFYAHRK